MEFVSKSILPFKLFGLNVECIIGKVQLLNLLWKTWRSLTFLRLDFKQRSIRSWERWQLFIRWGWHFSIIAFMLFLFKDKFFPGIWLLSLRFLLLLIFSLKVTVPLLLYHAEIRVNRKTYILGMYLSFFLLKSIIILLDKLMDILMCFWDFNGILSIIFILDQYLSCVFMLEYWYWFLFRLIFINIVLNKHLPTCIFQERGWQIIYIVIFGTTRLNHFLKRRTFLRIRWLLSLLLYNLYLLSVIINSSEIYIRRID